MKKNKAFAFGMILPATVCILLISIYPVLNGIYLSFTNYSILNMNHSKFVGLINFKNILFNSPEFWKILGFTVIYTFATVVFSYLVGMAMALLINMNIPFRGIFRAVLLLPWIIPSVVAANSWLWILNDQTGIINIFLMKIGIINHPILFLSTSVMAKVTVIMESTWKNYPFMMLVLLAGLQSIPDELHESACMDGANKVKDFFYITLPMLKAVTITSTILMMIWTFNNFENIYLMTRGGPAKSTMVMSIFSYNTAFYDNKLGVASSISVVMMIIMIILSQIYRQVLKNNQD